MAQSQKLKMSSHRRNKRNQGKCAATIMRPTPLKGGRKLVAGASHQPKQCAMMPSGLIPVRSLGTRLCSAIRIRVHATHHRPLRWRRPQVSDSLHVQRHSTAHAHESNGNNNLLQAHNTAWKGNKFPSEFHSREEQNVAFSWQDMYLQVLAMKWV